MAPTVGIDVERKLRIAAVDGEVGAESSPSAALPSPLEAHVHLWITWLRFMTQ